MTHLTLSNLQTALMKVMNGCKSVFKWDIKSRHIMKYIGIGNEQYGDIYFERYEEFAKQIHGKYPDINLVTTSGTASKRFK